MMKKKDRKEYAISYEELIKKIFSEFEIMKADIERALNGFFLPSKRARVKSIEITRLLKEYRERSADETRKLMYKKNKKNDKDRA